MHSVSGIRIWIYEFINEYFVQEKFTRKIGACYIKRLSYVIKSAFKTAVHVYHFRHV